MSNVPPLTPSHEEDRHSPIAPRPEAFWVAAFLIVVAVATVFVVVWRKDFNDTGEFIIIVGMFALVVSSALGLLAFAKADIEWKARDFVFRGTGPAAVMAMILYTGTRPELLQMVKAPKPQKTWDEMVIEREAVDRKDGWIGFEEWRTPDKISNCSKVYDDINEPSSVKTLFSMAYFRRGDIDSHKLANAKIETLLFYFRGKTYPDGVGEPRSFEERRYIKIQLISGSKSTLGLETYVHFLAQSSLANGSPHYEMFSREGGEIKGHSPKNPGSNQPKTDWVQLDIDDVDACVVAYYPNGNNLEGNDFWTDVPKYTAKTANVFTGVCSEDRFKSGAISSWLMQPNVTGNGAGVPLELRSTASAVHMDRSVDEDHINRFQKWLVRLDDYRQKHKDEFSEFLNKLLAEFLAPEDANARHPGSYEDFLRPASCSWPYYVSVEANQISNPMGIVFSWDR